MKPPVLTKHDFVRRYKAGEFGNAAPTWNRLQDCLYSDYEGLIHIRNRVAGGPTFYSLTKKQVFEAYCRETNAGRMTPGNIYFSGMAPHDKGTIQGELQQTRNYLDLEYNLQQVPMRDGFAIERLRATGVEALGLLQIYLCARSYRWMMHLLDEYPEHVIEFSSFSTNWGTIPGYNTVFWEVRNY